MLTNERIAAACGFELCREADGSIYYLEWDEVEEWAPDTDPAAALFALEAYGRKRFANVTAKYFTEKGKTLPYEAMIFDPVECCEVGGAFGDSFCQAICAAILAAELSNKE